MSNVANRSSNSMYKSLSLADFIFYELFQRNTNKMVHCSMYNKFCKSLDKQQRRQLKLIPFIKQTNNNNNIIGNNNNNNEFYYYVSFDILDLCFIGPICELRCFNKIHFYSSIDQFKVTDIRTQLMSYLLQYLYDNFGSYGTIKKMPYFSVPYGYFHSFKKYPPDVFKLFIQTYLCFDIKYDRLVPNPSKHFMNPVDAPVIHNPATDYPVHRIETFATVISNSTGNINYVKVNRSVGWIMEHLCQCKSDNIDNNNDNNNINGNHQIWCPFIHFNPKFITKKCFDWLISFKIRYNKSRPRLVAFYSYQQLMVNFHFQLRNYFATNGNSRWREYYNMKIILSLDNIKHYKNCVDAALNTTSNKYYRFVLNPTMVKFVAKPQIFFNDYQKHCYLLQTNNNNNNNINNLHSIINKILSYNEVNDIIFDNITKCVILFVRVLEDVNKFKRFVSVVKTKNVWLEQRHFPFKGKFISINFKSFFKFYPNHFNELFHQFNEYYDPKKSLNSTFIFEFIDVPFDTNYGDIVFLFRRIMQSWQIGGEIFHPLLKNSNLKQRYINNNNNNLNGNYKFEFFDCAFYYLYFNYQKELKLFSNSNDNIHILKNDEIIGYIGIRRSIPSSNCPILGDRSLFRSIHRHYCYPVISNGTCYLFYRNAYVFNFLKFNKKNNHSLEKITHKNYLRISKEKKKEKLSEEEEEKPQSEEQEKPPKIEMDFNVNQCFINEPKPNIHSNNNESYFNADNQPFQANIDKKEEVKECDGFDDNDVIAVPFDDESFDNKSFNNNKLLRRGFSSNAELFEDNIKNAEPFEDKIDNSLNIDKKEEIKECDGIHDNDEAFDDNKQNNNKVIVFKRILSENAEEIKESDDDYDYDEEPIYNQHEKPIFNAEPYEQHFLIDWKHYFNVSNPDTVTFFISNFFLNMCRKNDCCFIFCIGQFVNNNNDVINYPTIPLLKNNNNNINNKDINGIKDGCIFKIKKILTTVDINNHNNILQIYNRHNLKKSNCFVIIGKLDPQWIDFFNLLKHKHSLSVIFVLNNPEPYLYRSDPSMGYFVDYNNEKDCVDDDKYSYEIHKSNTQSNETKNVFCYYRIYQNGFPLQCDYQHSIVAFLWD